MSATEWSGDWKAKLTQCGLGTWDALWTADGEVVEAPNAHARGHSWVTRLKVHFDHTTEPAELYLKRQVNWTARRFSQLFLKVPRARSEWRSLLLCQAADLPVPQPVCYASRKEEGELRSLIATVKIPQAYALDTWYERRSRGEAGAQTLSPQDWWKTIREAGATVRRFHRKGLRHGSLYPKHLYLSKSQGHPVVLIDLERMRWFPMRRRGHLRDLESLHRRTPQASRTERLRFLLGWQGAPRVNQESRKLWKMVHQRAAKKRK